MQIFVKHLLRILEQLGHQIANRPAGDVGGVVAALVVEAVVPVYEALRTMRETRNHLATVTDGGQVVGLITISDVLQRLLVR